MSHFFYALKKVYIFSILGLFMTMSSNAFAIKPFSVVYKFSIDNLYTGEATRTLKQQADGKWHYSLSAAVPLVAKASQESTFLENNGRLQPISYMLQYKVLVHKRTTKLDFDYESQVINIKDKGKQRTLPLPDAPLDELIAELQVREDLSKNALKASYQIVNKKKVEDVVFKNLGKTTITVPAGTFDVIKVQRMHPTPKRKTFFWLSPKHNYLPIKMMQDDKGKIYDSELKRFK